MLQVDLIDDRNDLEFVFHGREGVGDGLRFDALERIDQQQGALTAGQRAGHFVVEVDVPRRVNQVQFVLFVLKLALHGHGPGLDGDAASPLQGHVIEHLFPHLALVDRAGDLQQAVRQRALAMVNVGDDAEVSDVLAIE